ncbi:polyprenyl synthetase family protein [Anaerococcus sp.]|uniref:polyprenyl synthetase family protein n=1 Tax=Anaerococcus sp. TaxID=1872515 RepID=UPI00257AABFA|nr:polyprenyl synthetase family protein [Anaerococcus sp.]MBS6105835.1 polyprenyl synthetase family protein [Anaerococcus sp.]MDU2598163.1 polyprenyl synthetase family protein [Anaerococcus sp.]MDU4025503.1 polyprenyl synthetase family protein [Anaerococcus sp.]MDU5534995.1 polyprenyl synthetase family protein [Anaerococcus sp.]
MNKEDFLKKLDDNKKIIEKKISTYYDKDYKLAEALFYAMDSGKRIRANLYFETLKMLDHQISELDVDFALAIEMVHAYSLVHDDLPAMDNDDFRRGKPSMHKKFGEDIAILAGDALLNEASFLIFDIANKNPSYIKAGRYLFNHTGYKGMIDGQVLDLRHPKTYDIDYLLNVYDKKTSDLFKACIVSAALISQVDEKATKILEDYAYNLGLAYQIQDDLLENTYKDELNILNVMVKTDAIYLLDIINAKARENILQFKKNDFLLFLVDYLSVREK